MSRETDPAPEWEIWEGGDCPLAEIGLFDIATKGGCVDYALVYPPLLGWHHTGGEGDIIAFREWQ